MPRQRSKPARGGPSLYDLVTFGLTTEAYAELAALLGKRATTGFSSLQSNIEYLSNHFRDALVQDTLAIPRPIDRATNLEIVKLATSLTDALGKLDEPDRDRLSRIVAQVPERDLWPIRTQRLRTILAHIFGAGSGSSSRKLARCADFARDLVVQLDAIDIHATTHAGIWMGAATRTGGDEPGNVLDDFRGDLVDLVAAARDAADYYGGQKGPAGNVNLQLFVAGIDAAVEQHRGKPLRHVAGRDGSYSGQPESDDDMFVTELLALIFASVPLCIVAREPARFRPNAALDMLKERIEARNKLQSKEIAAGPPVA